MHTISASAANSSSMRLPPLSTSGDFARQPASGRGASAASTLRVTISSAGRQAALQAQRAEAVTVFAKMDSDHDGKVNSAEFDAAAGSPPTPASAPLRAAVKAYDDASPAALDNAAHTGATDLLA